MITIGYKLLSSTARAPDIAFEGTNHTMGIDIFTDKDHTLRTVYHYDTTTAEHPHSSTLPYSNMSTGIALELPPGVHVSWGGRSGLAFKEGLIPFEGKIDANYRGEIKAKIWSLNPHDDGRVIPAGTKIAQLYVLQYSNEYLLKPLEELSVTTRGINGFGSTT